MAPPREPAITFVMPVHDGADFIEEAVRSVLAQSVRELRLLVVDDASTDATPEVLARIDDARLEVVTLPQNRGRTGAVQEGLVRVRTEHVGLLDADDVALPTLVEASLAVLLERPDVDVVGTQLVPVDAQGRRAGPDTDFPLEHDAIVEQLLVAPALAKSGMIARTEPLARVGLRAPADVAEDYHLWADLLLAGARFANLPDALCLYRRHPAQSTVREAVEMAAAHRAVQRMLVDRLWPEDPEADRAEMAEWLAWRRSGRTPSSVRDPAVMDRSLRASGRLVDARPAHVPTAAARAARRRVIEQELVAWGGVPSWRGLMSCRRELSGRELLAVARRILREQAGRLALWRSTLSRRIAPADAAQRPVVDRVVISLAGDPRREAFLARPDSRGFRVHDAFDGRDGRGHPLFDEAVFAHRYGRPPLGGEVGVSISHYLVLEQFACAPGAEEDMILVAEDDAVPVADLDQVLRRALRGAAPVDVLLLGELGSLPHADRAHRPWWAASSLAVQLSWLARPAGPADRPLSVRRGRWRGEAWGVGLYAMSRGAARRYVELVRRHRIDWVADDFTRWGELADIDVQVVLPALATFEGPSTIKPPREATPPSRALRRRWRESLSTGRAHLVILVRGAQATAKDLRARRRRRPGPRESA